MLAQGAVVCFEFTTRCWTFTIDAVCTLIARCLLQWDWECGVLKVGSALFVALIFCHIGLQA
jgi:hypothetical protein